MSDQATQLILLASLLEPAIYPEDELLRALQTARGDLSRAAEELLLPRVKSTGKRKAGSLESWVKRDKPNDNPKDEKLKDAFSLLSDSGPSKPRNAPQPALLITSQAAIDKHKLPLRLLDSPLSPSFASALYLALMEESEAWGRHRWYLAGSYYQEGGGYGGSVPYYYSGKELPMPKPYPDLLRQAAELIEPVVNAALNGRPRYPLEYAGPWQANFCGANRYDGASSGVGWHADQLSYLGPYAAIASLSLGTPRAFRLRQTEAADPAFKTGPIRTYEVNLGHNSLIVMTGGCQERFKHT